MFRKYFPSIAVRAQLFALFLTWFWAQAAAADPLRLGAFFEYLTRGDRHVIAEVPVLMGFEGNSAGVYSDHLTKTWSDPVLRKYLAQRMAPAARWKDDGNIDLESFEFILSVMPFVMTARSDFGAYRIEAAPKAVYMRAMHKAFRVIAAEGLDACLRADLSDIRYRPDEMIGLAQHRVRLLKAMDAKTLQAYLQVQRQAARAEILEDGAAMKLSEAELELAYGHIDGVLDRLVVGHPNAENIHDFWFEGLDDDQTFCDVSVLDWSVLDELDGEGLALAAQYYLEFYNGEH